MYIPGSADICGFCGNLYDTGIKTFATFAQNFASFVVKHMRQPTITFFLKYRFPALLWTIVLSVLCLLPGDRIPPEPVLNADKIFHAGAFGLLAFLWSWAFHGRPFSGGRAVWLAVAVSVILGGLIEILQETVAINRSADWIDFWADTAGAIAGGLFFFFVFRTRNKNVQ